MDEQDYSNSRERPDRTASGQSREARPAPFGFGRTGAPPRSAASGQPAGTGRDRPMPFAAGVALRRPGAHSVLPDQAPPAPPQRSASTVDNRLATHRGRSASSVVDTNRASSFDVDNVGGSAHPPLGIQRRPVQGAVRAPAPRPKGPDPAKLEALRRAGRERLGSKAKTAGVDPGAGAEPSRESPSAAARKGTTRSRETTMQYLNRGRLLLNRYRREAEIPEYVDEVNPVDFVNWLFSMKPILKASTWRVYRQAAWHLVEGSPHDDAEAAAALIESETSSEGAKPEARRPTGTGKRGRTSKRTSSKKEKRFPKGDLDKVLRFLKTFSRSRMSATLVDWLRAGTAVGLRPIEWRATDLEEIDNPDGSRTVLLYVLNAKHTNGRSNGAVRTLDISALSDDVIGCVRRMARNGWEWHQEGKFDTVQSQCAQLLYQVCEKIFGDRDRVYSLYSCRHQAMANWKSCLPHEEVSALAGHIVTSTANECYGKKRSAWDPDEIGEVPRPAAEEVATVRQRLKFFEDRIRLYREAGLPEPEFWSGEDEDDTHDLS